MAVNAIPNHSVHLPVLETKKNEETLIGVWIFYEALKRIKQVMSDGQIDQMRVVHEVFTISNLVTKKLGKDFIQLQKIQKANLEKAAQIEIAQHVATAFLILSVGAMAASPMATSLSTFGQGLFTGLKAMLQVGSAASTGVLGYLQIELSEALKDQAKVEEAVNKSQAILDAMDTTKEYLHEKLKATAADRTQVQDTLSALIASLRHSYSAAMR